ncbi:restriction endonuclease subunit S [Shewanella glacialipiscicola]|uniref:restriction endonuclease subunit S n=1 Tax=Shewanella glacialipiscicola TaxID=614069 RepID=UPI003D78F6E1
MTWTTVKIGDVAQVKGGKRLPKGMSVQDMVTEYPYVRVTDFDPDGVNLNSVKFISKEAHKATSRYIINCTDVYISIAGTIGLVGIVPKQLDGANLTENAAKICEISEDINPQFLMYFLRSRIGQGLINAQVVGTSQPKLALFRIKDIEIPAPEKTVQDEIASVLSKYDNLIENNNRRIAILEDMAQSLYREWFVNFRYQNHEDNLDADGKPKLIDSPLGQIPEGWEVKNAAEVITINPKTKLVKEGEKPFVGMSGLSQGSMVIGDIIEKTGNSGAKFINGDTLFARITPCLQNGKTGYVQFLTPEQPVGFGSTEFIVFRESEYLSSEFIYLLSRSNNFREHAIQSMTGATGRQRVHNDCFASCYLPVPPKELMHEFTKLAKPMFKSIFNLSKRNENLKQQRDMLLPKLISGQIEL